MNVFARVDHLLAVTGAADQRTRTDDLVAEIADALAAAGECVTWVDVGRTQQVVDVNWAAHQAGRRLGIRVHVEVQIAKAAADDRVPVLVTRQRPPD